MTDIYTLGVKADTTDIDRGTDRLDDFADSADKADKKTGQFREGVNTAGKAIVAFGVTTATALGLVTVAAGNTARELSNMSRLANSTVEDFQRTAFAARAYGVEQDKLADILKDTQDKVGDFLAGKGGELKDFFEIIAPRVGVTAEAFRNLNGKDALQLYASTLEAANISQSEMVFYMESIADEAVLLQPLLANNGEELLRLAKRADDLGIVLDEIDISNLNDMKTVLSEMGAISEATANVIGATLAPFVTSLGEEFNAAAINGDQLRDAMIDTVEVGVMVAGVYADAGRVFEIVGRSIGALAFTIAESNSNIEKHLDLSIALFVQWANSIDLALAEWVNAQDAELTRWASSVVNAVDVFDMFDDVVIKPQPLDTSGLEATADAMETRIAELEESLVGSNESIENAWNDVVDLMSQPIPSDGFDAWFAALKKTITAQRELQKSIKTTGAVNRDVVKDAASDAVKWISNTKEVTKGLGVAFGENEKAAKVLHNVNLAIGIAEQAMILSKVFADDAATVSEVANSGVRATAKATEAVAGAATAPFPVGFAAAAAMIGLMAAIGVSVGGGASAPSISEQRQETQGTGTLLGSSEKSQSILDSQERFEDLNIEQLAELRGIRAGIGAIADGVSLVARDLVAGGGLGNFGGSLQGKEFTDSQAGNIIGKLTKGITGDFLFSDSVINDLFGSTKKKLVDSGINFVAQSLSEIVETGSTQASQFFDIETTKKKLFGLSKKTSVSTEFNAIDQAINDQIGAIFGNVADTVADAVVLLGLNTDKDIREAFEAITIDLGMISFEGLTGAEIEEELQAVISQQADIITGKLVPALEKYQQVGEGLFGTLTRVTFEQAMFNDSIAAMGNSLADLSAIMQIDIAQSVIELIGGIEEFADATSAFVDGFFSEAEKTKILGDSLADVFDSLGEPMTVTREGFRELVESMDLTTETGREMFAVLLQISPAMADYIEQMEDQTEALEENAAALQAALDGAASDAFDMLQEAVELERDRIAEVLAGEKSIFAEEIKRINGVRSALKDIFKELTADVATAEKAVEAAFAAEKTAIEQSSALRIAGFNSERIAAEDLHTAQVTQIGIQRTATQGIISSLEGLGDRLRGVAPENSRQARADLETALNAARGGNFAPALGVDVNALRQDSSQFETAEQLNVAQATTGFSADALANLVDDQLSIEELTLETLQRQEENAQTAFDKQLTAIDKQIEAEEKATELQLSFLESELNAVLGIETGVLSVEEAIADLRTTQAAVTALEFEQQMVALAQEEDLAAEALDQAEDAAREQSAQLDLVVNTGRAQLRALFNVNDSVLSVREAIVQLGTSIAAADESAALAAAAIAKSTASTAKTLQNTQLNAENV